MSRYPLSRVANRVYIFFSNFEGRAKMPAVWMISMLEVHAGDVWRIQNDNLFLIAFWFVLRRWSGKFFEMVQTSNLHLDRLHSPLPDPAS